MSIRHEKIIKRKDGTQYNITVTFYVDLTRIKYDVYLSKKLKGKRKWMSNYNYDSDYKYRSLSIEDREEFRQNKILEEVSQEEVQAAKLELWEKLKPVIKD